MAVVDLPTPPLLHIRVIIFVLFAVTDIYCIIDILFELAVKLPSITVEDVFSLR